jgi:hypothetical protein
MWIIGRAIGGALAATVVAGAALVLGYRGYQAYLEWLVAGAGKPSDQPTPSGTRDD